MGQKLILPIDKAKLTASMKTAAYQKKYGFVHYGIDMVSTAGDRAIWGSGNGAVVAAGYDNVVGNVVAVVYQDALNRKTGYEHDLVIRYFHLESIGVRVGDKVTVDTKLGVYGRTGQLNMANHLHLEADTDVNYPLYSPTVSSSNLIKGRSAGAIDTTMSSALDWMFCKTSAPDYQTYTTTKDAYILQADYAIAEIGGDESTETGSDCQCAEEGKTAAEVRLEGIDVSVHNGAVDWTKVKAAKDFVFVRIGWAGWDGGIRSNGGLDGRFAANMQGANAAGLNAGIYLYSYCKTEAAARAAAKEVLELVKPYTLNYPIAFDIEDTSDSGVRYDKMGRAANTAIVKAFLDEIKAGGYYGMVYTYKSFAESYLNMPALSGYDTWIAQYATSNSYNGAYTIWQYKGDVKGFIGSCPGVTGNCDLNVCYKDYEAVIEDCHYNGLTDR